MTVKLTDDFKTQLETWIGVNKRQKFTLLYKASRDGCASTTFHTQCDNKGSTVTVLYNTDNTVYGGYTSIGWHSNGTYSDDASAFLFRLNYNGTFQPLKFPAKTATNAIYDHSSYGPTFGGGHDLYCFNGTVNYSGSYFALNGSSSPGNTYDMHGSDVNAFTNGHMKVLDIEVYSVEDMKNAPEQRKPWRKCVMWGGKVMKELMAEVEKYKPPTKLNVPKANILLIGQVGAGKSSFFNTIISIFRGYITGQAPSGSAEHSLTTAYRMYKIWKNESEKPLNFRLCDTQGLEEDQGIDTNEIGYILEGHVPDKYQFNPAVPLSPDVSRWVKAPTLVDKIHCVTFIIDGSTIDVMPEKVLERIRRLQVRMNQKGVPQVVLLTKIDKMCEMVSEDVSEVFSSPSIREGVEKVSMMTGLPRQQILPFKN